MKVEPTSTDEPVIVMRRTFDAPRELVWDALTDPKQVALWYGGHGFANPVCEMDVRPGGKWRHVMRTPDGVEHALELEFVDVKRPERLVWRSAGAAAGHYKNTMTVTLEAEGKKTRWTLVTRFGSIADRDASLAIGFTAILAEGADKLNDLVTER